LILGAAGTYQLEGHEEHTEPDAASDVFAHLVGAVAAMLLLMLLLMCCTWNCCPGLKPTPAVNLYCSLLFKQDRIPASDEWLCMCDAHPLCTMSAHSTVCLLASAAAAAAAAAVA
jgi:hypothetical protein